MRAPPPAYCRLTAWLVPQIPACKQSEGPTLGPGPAPRLPMAWPFPSPCQCPQSWCSPAHTQPLRSLPPPLFTPQAHICLSTAHSLDTKSWLWCILHNVMSSALQLKLLVCSARVPSPREASWPHCISLVYPGGDHISVPPAQRPSGASES